MPDDPCWYGWSPWKLRYYVDPATGSVISCLWRSRHSKDRTLAFDDPDRYETWRRWAVPEIHRRDQHRDQDLLHPEGPCRSQLTEIVGDAIHGLHLLGSSSRIPIEIQNLHRVYWDRVLRAEGHHGKVLQRCRLCGKPPKLGTGGRFAGLGTEILCGRCMGLKPALFKARLIASKGRGRWSSGRYISEKEQRLEALNEEGSM